MKDVEATSKGYGRWQLYAAGAFTGGDKTIGDGDTLQVTAQFDMTAAMADAYEWMVYFRMRETEPGLRQCMKQLVKFGSEVDS